MIIGMLAAMGSQEELAYIAITGTGYVDGACFTESEDSAQWVREMEQAGMTVKRVPRREAKALLFTQLPTNH